MGLEMGLGIKAERLEPRRKICRVYSLGVLKEEVAGASSGLKQPRCVKTGYEETNVIPIPFFQD